MTDDELIKLLRPRYEKLLICRVTDIGGVESPMTAKTALKRHPELFRELFEELRRLIETQEGPKVEQKRLF